MSTFNPEQFLSTEITELGETKYTPVPEGEWAAQVQKVDVKAITSKKSGDEFTVLEITWNIPDERVKTSTGLDEPTVRQSIFLDLKANGALDFGRNKNVPLSRLREAVGQQREGRPWALSHLIGSQAIVLVKHRLDDNGDPQADVSKVVGLNAARGREEAHTSAPRSRAK